MPQEQYQGVSQTDIEERFDAQVSEPSPEYFIIARDFLRFEEQKDLRDFLDEHYPLVAKGDDYWVFDLRERSDH